MKKAILLSIVVVFGVVLFLAFAAKGETTGEYIGDATVTTQVKAIIAEDQDAQHLKIEATTTRGEVMLQGFVSDRETEERLVVKIKQIKGPKSVKSLLKMQ